MSRWKIFETGTKAAQENMDLDAKLLDGLDPDGEAILHFYDWNLPSATYGYFVKPSDFLDLEEARANGLDLARRPTGGGIVFHVWDLAFSVLIPSKHPNFSENTLENYAFVNQKVLKAAEPFLESKEAVLIGKDANAEDTSCKRFCMARPTKYDVVHKGMKIAGAAQRKTKKGFLHQGTIALKSPDFALLAKVLLPGTKVLEAMKKNTFSLLGSNETLEEGRKKMKQQLTTQFCYVTESENSNLSHA